MDDGPDARREGVPTTLRIGEWSLDRSSGEIRKGTTIRRLEPRHVDVLVYLVQRSGQVVSKVELLGAVWSDSFVGDKALVRCIAGLRKAFGDDPRRPCYIETLHRRGYRLVAPVAPGHAAQDVSASPLDPVSDEKAGSAAAAREVVDRESSRPRLGRPALAGALGGALVLAAIGLISGWFSGRERPDGATPQPVGTAPDFATVAVFDNLTEQRRLDSLRTVFRIGLEQSPLIGVIPETQVRAALVRMERDPDAAIDRAVGIELCRREGARFLVRGETALIGGVVTLSAEVVDPTTDETVLTADARAEDEADVLPALDRLVSDVRAALGETVERSTGSPTALEKVTTSDLSALEAYSLGKDAWRHGHFGEAAAHYRSALEIDPGFAMARVALGLGLLSAERPEGRVELRRALESTERLPLFEQLYARAWLATTEIDYPEMKRLWTLIATLFPENAVGQFNLGMVRGLYGGEPEVAASMMGPAASRLGPAFNLRPALVELRLGHLEKALALVASQSDPPSRGLAGYEVLVQMAAGRPLEALELLESPEAWHGDDRAWGWYFYYLDRGRLRMASEALEAVRYPSEEKYSHMHLLIARALALHRVGGPAAAEIRNAARLVVDRAEETANLGNSPIPLIVSLGTLAARAGELATGEELLDAAQALTRDKPTPTHRALTEALAGEVLAARGLHSEAIERYRDSLDTVEVYQAFEGLARSHLALAEPREAIGPLQTLLDSRGQAFGECFELRYYCAGLEGNVLRWNDARYDLAQAYEAMGRPTEAHRNYRLFAQQWRDGDDEIAQLRDARRRLGAGS